VSEAQHTPGPWKVFGVRRNQYLAVIDSIPDQDGKVIANCICHVAMTNPDAQANAEFIVRACNAHDDLLEACEQALICIEQDEHTHGRNFGAGNVLRAAIAKAKGVST
jgi:hypothetical protein